MARRTSGRTFARIPDSIRRKKSWLAFGEVGLNTVGTSLNVIMGAGPSEVVDILFIDSAGAASAGLLEGTLMRIRGSVSVDKSTPPASGGTDVIVAFGIGFVTDEVAVAAAVPNPATIAGADWDGWLFYRSNVAAPADANATLMDSKAMRKWNSGMSLVLVAGAANNAGASAANSSVLAVMRGLFFLP